VIIMLILGLALIACTVGLCLHASGLRRAHVVETIDGIAEYGFRPRRSGADSAETRRTLLLTRLDGVAGGLGALAASLGFHKEEELRRELRAAAMYGLTPRKLLGYRVLAGAGLPLFWLWVSTAGGGSFFRTALGCLVLGFGGWQGPLLYVRRRARARLEEIDYQMPELIDVLVTTVEAGIGFSGSLQMAAQRMQGALGAELRLTLAEQGMGLSTEEALSNMLDRADAPAMRSFVRSVLQGETLGVSIGKIMRELAVEMRKRRRQKAEERAQKAPTKMLFPLVFLIFPAMFVVLLGPAVIDLLRAFSHL
jgi:tight adherence protein C